MPWRTSGSSTTPRNFLCTRSISNRLPPDVLNISARVIFLMTMMLTIWFMREAIYEFIETRIIPHLGLQQRTPWKRSAPLCWIKPVQTPLFVKLSQWIVVLFLRCPALVLMFAASNNSLVMPSYPLEPKTLFLFQIAQVIMGIGILTQTALPLGGATIFGTFIYMLYAYDWKIAVDVLPVLTVAVLYVSSPWDSWKRAITTITPQQMRWVRIILGFGFFALGWMKIYNYYLTVGVIDNYPAVKNDPMIHMFWIGTTPDLWRENWIMGFAIAEVMTGFLLMLGVFCRVWCLMMVFVFTKLMVVDFGWAEIPHLYPIAAFLAVLFSNTLSSEFEPIEARSAVTARANHWGAAVMRSFVIALIISILAVIPMLKFLTLVKHPSFQ